MIVCKCVAKYKDETGKIFGYKLMDESGRFQDIMAKDLKELVNFGEYNVINLTLTSDLRLINSSEEAGAEIREITISKEAIKPNKGNSAGLKVVRVLEFTDQGAIRKVDKDNGSKYIGGKVISTTPKYKLVEVPKTVGCAVLNTSDAPVKYRTYRAKIQGYTYSILCTGEAAINPGEISILRNEEVAIMFMQEKYRNMFTNCRLMNSAQAMLAFRSEKEYRSETLESIGIHVDNCMRYIHTIKPDEPAELLVARNSRLEFSNDIAHYQIGIKQPNGKWILKDEAKAIFAELEIDSSARTDWNTIELKKLLEIDPEFTEFINAIRVLSDKTPAKCEHGLSYECLTHAIRFMTADRVFDAVVKLKGMAKNGKPTFDIEYYIENAISGDGQHRVRLEDKDESSAFNIIKCLFYLKDPTTSIHTEDAVKAVKKEIVDSIGADAIGKFSDSIVVTNQLIFSDEGNMKMIKKAVGEKYKSQTIIGSDGKEIKRVMRDTAGNPIHNPDYRPAEYEKCGAIVGYIIKNVSNNDIKMSAYDKTITLKAGESTAISTRDIKVILASTDFAYHFANCVLVDRGTHRNTESVDEIIKGLRVRITDDSMLRPDIQTGIKGEDGSWTIRYEYKFLEI